MRRRVVQVEKLTRQEASKVAQANSPKPEERRLTGSLLSALAAQLGISEDEAEARVQQYVKTHKR